MSRAITTHELSTRIWMPAILPTRQDVPNMAISLSRGAPRRVTAANGGLSAQVLTGGRGAVDGLIRGPLGERDRDQRHDVLLLQAGGRHAGYAGELPMRQPSAWGSVFASLGSLAGTPACRPVARGDSRVRAGFSMHWGAL